MLPHLACRVFGTPLLIQRAKLDILLAVLAPRLGLDQTANISVPTLALPMPKPLTGPGITPPGIVVIPIYGTLVKRTLGLDAASGLTSYLDISHQLDAALADPQVAGILLDIDSPGGEAAGVFELARRVRAAASLKPVWAQANDSAFSAAYAIATAADRLYLTETGGVGSIGVIALHVDQSAKDAEAGIRYTAVFAGAHKNDLSPHAPLTIEAHTTLQAEVDRLYAVFVSHIARMRQLDQEVVRATEAAQYFGEQAVVAGLADGLQSLDVTLNALQRFLAPPPPRPPGRSTRSALLNLDQEPIMTQEQQETSPTLSLEEVAAQVADARREAALSAQAIAELCLIAGVPERAAMFIAGGHSEADVRRALLESRAARSDAQSIHSTLTLPAPASSAAEPSPLIAAVKKLVAKE